MKSFKYIFLFFCLTQFLFAQSSIVYEAGTNIEVQAGADLCADVVTIQGTYTGSGTLCTGPLPVELSVFNATVKNNVVDLYWKTETEVNNYGFIIERRVNASNWDSLAFIKGYGNSNSPKEYTYSDKNLIVGGSKFEYRLKQVDNDGSSEYSDVVEVEVVPNKYDLAQNYPNPFNPSTTIQFSLPKQTELKLRVYNILGQLIKTIAEGVYETGYHKIIFNATGLPSGTYVYRIESSEFVQVKKMILLK